MVSLPGAQLDDFICVYIMKSSPRSSELTDPSHHLVTIFFLFVFFLLWG